ncbi:MAG TPA: LPS assembly protein LptD [Candidatus Paceibacterota bacterium]|nr:LPS assembly protein LptD [Candidatus Paceibacterota bacterium]
MTHFRLTLTLAIFLLANCWTLRAQTNETSEGDIISGEGMFDLNTRVATFTNNVLLRYNGVVLTADSASINEETGETVANGKVRIQQEDMIWAGEHIRYNFKTHEMTTEQFRTGRAPVFASGRGLRGEALGENLTNQVYYATNAMITADDFYRPLLKIRAKQIRIVPGKRIEATHATVWAGNVPVFYFPYYTRSLGPNANNLNVTPGYRSRYGPFILGTYTWLLNDQLDGELHLDYRQKRGVGTGPDLNFHLGRWGDGTVSYYYTRDDDPRTNGFLAPVLENRQRLQFSYQANPYTNFNVKSLVRYQNDIGVVRDFFESEYRRDPQPNTFVEANKFWQNFSLDVLAQPRVNNFYETVERLPDVRLTGFRQQLGSLPLYYESESSVGYYRRLFAKTNNAPGDLDFAAGRADTYHQITLPETFFGWLNVIPRVGGRFSYYTDATGPAGTTLEESRCVFNTGAEVNFKASRLWPEVQSKALDLDGLRHIVQPSVNYVFVPRPNVRPNEIPKFDYELASLRMLPIEYPEYNAIDSVDTQNAIRWGLQNKLQTKRNGQVEDWLNWEVFTDWRLKPQSTQLTNYQQTFSDIFSDVTLRPRSWMTLQSQTRYDIDEKKWTMALHTMTLQPNDTWSWTIGHFYLRNDTATEPTFLGLGNNLITSSIYYRANENWGFRATHHYDLISGRMSEQYYTAYRDLRSWTAALTFGLREEVGRGNDFLVAFTFSLKAAPRFNVGGDTVTHTSLLGR